MTEEERAQFESLLGGLDRHPVALRMKRYIQHGQTSTYDHCLSVARGCFLANRKLHLHADEKSLVRAAFLHDLYLYDWHNASDWHKWHGFKHSKFAARNAVRYFGVSREEERSILSHMWPLNLTRIPRRREAWILCAVDKYISLKETLHS